MQELYLLIFADACMLYSGSAILVKFSWVIDELYREKLKTKPVEFIPYVLLFILSWIVIAQNL